MVKILLLKEPKNKEHKHYLHSKMEYSMHDFAFSVNKNNLVTGYRTTLYMYINNKNSLYETFTPRNTGLTPKQYEKKALQLTGDKTFVVHSLNFKPLPTEYDVLTKPVRGIRYATSEEKSKLELLIVGDLCNNEPISFTEQLYDSPRLRKLYSQCMTYDIIDAYFKYCDGERV